MLVKDVEKLEPLSTAGGNVKFCSHFGKVLQFLKWINIELSYDPTVILLSTHLKQNHLSHKTCTWMFMAVLFIIAKKWKQPKCPSTNEWVNKMLYIHWIEYYSAVKRNGVLLHATMQMNLKNIILSEKTVQSQKTI